MKKVIVSLILLLALSAGVWAQDVIPISPGAPKEAVEDVRVRSISSFGFKVVSTDKFYNTRSYGGNGFYSRVEFSSEGYAVLLFIEMKGNQIIANYCEIGQLKDFQDFGDDVNGYVINGHKYTQGFYVGKDGTQYTWVQPLDTVRDIVFYFNLDE